MQHLNDDIDELFRRAAESYPLNTSSADWDRVNAMLAQTDKEDLPEQKKWRFFWLLLLVLPAMLICNRPAEGTLKSAAATSVTGTAASIPTQEKKLKNESAIPNDLSFQVMEKQYRTKPAQQKKDAFLNTTSLQDNVAFNKPFLQDAEVSAASVLEQKSLSTNQENQTGVQAGIKSGEVLSKKTAEVPAVAAKVAALDTMPDEEFSSSADPVAQEQNSTDSMEQNPLVTARRRFFVSVVAGPDVSTVKFQRFSNVGFGAGVLIGYSISHRFAVEAGALSSKKYYYSKGDYFNQKKLYLPPNTNMLAVDGVCRMIELPVSLRYTFGSNEKKAWFAAAGLSSYLMQSENYQYTYVYLPSGYPASYQKTYKNQSRNWLSVVQLSMGYSSRLGQLGSLRIEPYYTLPLKGVGYGELPLSSLGIRFGLTSRHF